MRLLEAGDIDGDIGQRAGAVTNPAGQALKRETKALIDPRMAHFDAAENGLELALYGRDGVGRAHLAAFHAQDTGLLARDDVGRVDGSEAVFEAEIIDAAVGADLAALAAMDAMLEKILFP